jgi:G6PDH family F420-dependent oxidoreductase
VTLIGYTMMCEQAGPKQLVRDVALAEEAGFDFAVISDHYFRWLDAQGHSPYAWSVLGAAAQATDHIPLMTYVACPIRPYHPAVVAQKAATMQAAVRRAIRPWARRRREPARAHCRRTLAPCGVAP